MRMILFRGKQIDSREWLHGNLITEVFTRCGQDIPYILSSYKAEYDCFEDFSEENGIYEVDPETVCQYTGYMDLWAKKAFEHDIVFYEDKGCYGHIVFKEGQFLIKWQESRPDLRSDIHFWFTKRRLYIVGNIFDNPELMEVDDETD